MPKTAKIVGGIVLLLLGLQLVPLDRTPPATDPAADFVTANNVPADLAGTIRTACYDCHSYATEYPWYARVAPVSFWIQHHVIEGRDHLNFATWTDYPLKKQAHQLEECWELVKAGEMPLRSYTWLHPPARLEEPQRQALIQFFQEMEFNTSISLAE